MNKNIIYKLVGGVVLLLVGEGVFGWALYWLALWFLLDWSWVYWLAFGWGFILVGLTGLEVGLPSLVLVLGVWLMSFLRGWVGKETWLDILVVLIVAWLANLALSLEFSLVEAVLIGVTMVFWKTRKEQGGYLRV